MKFPRSRALTFIIRDMFAHQAGMRIEIRFLFGGRVNLIVQDSNSVDISIAMSKGTQHLGLER